VTGATKVLGRRTESPDATTTVASRIAFLEAYADRITTDPALLEEIGVVAPREARFQKPPRAPASSTPDASPARRLPTPDCHAHDSSRAIASGKPPSGIASSGRHRPTARGASLVTWMTACRRRRALDVEHLVVADVHRSRGRADGAQREGEDLGVRLAHAIRREGRMRK